MATEYFPSLSSLITLDDLPQELDFIEAGISSVFDNVYFRDLQFTRSPKGDSAYYSLVLILNRSVSINIPGADIRLALNPDFVSGSMTEIPITLEYEWKLLALLKKIKKFTTQGFSFDGKAFFELLTDVTGLTKEGLLQSALEQFTGASDPLAAVNTFIDEANTKYSTAVPHTVETNLARALAEAIGTVTVAAAKDPFTIIYEVYIEGGSAEEVLEKVKAVFAPLFDIDPIEYIKGILIPKINASLSLAPAGIGIIFPRKYLVPLDASNNMEPFPETGAANDKMSILGFGLGKFSFSTVSGFGYDEQLTATLNYPSQIGNTGLIINLTNAKLDLSRKKNIPEATQDGRPEDFMGVYIQELSITLPEKWFKQADHTTAMIYGRKLLIGTGGISGEIGLEATAAGHALPVGQKPAVKIKLGENDGFELGFEKFSLTFKQNAITASEIKGYLKIKGFKDAAGNDAQLDIKVSISDNGDFSITASEDQGISLIKIPDIVNVNIKSLSIGRKNDKFFVALSGVLDFADQSASSNGGFIGDNLPKDIEIQKLIIWQDGSFEFEGGGIELRKPLTMKVGPVELSITAIHFGSYEQKHNGILRKYKFFGFDGGVSIKPGGVDARGDGIKFYFTVDNGPGKPLDVFMRIQSIAIDIMIPGTSTPETAAVIMKGYLAMKSPTDGAASSDAGTEYSGGIELTLPKLKIAGSAAMRYNPSVPSFIIDIGLELPTALPLGSTGLGIYGFRGLFGLRYVADREYVGLPADAEWWQYYKKKVAPDNKEGIFINKMEQREGFSVGAGVSLCTVPDSGKTFSAKLFFMLSLPEVFLLQGQAAFLSDRIGLNDPNDPPFFALIAVSSTSIEAALGANYKMPATGNNAGKIVKLDGVLELAFFWGNSFSWYLNLGKETPEDRRIRARIFDLFDCYYFLMISSEGIYTGAGSSYSFNKTFLGVVKIKLHAYMDIRGKVSFKPLQIGGSIQLGASIEASIFGIGFGLSADAGLAAEAPKPFIITGFIKVKFKVLWKTFKFNIDFTWNFNNELDLSEVEILDNVVGNIAKAINAHTKEPFPLFIQKLGSVAAAMPTVPWANFESFTIPQDSFIDIEFKQGIHATGADPSLINFNDINSGFEYSVLIPPQKGKSKQVTHEFFVDKVELKIWNPQTNSWHDYHPYKAMSPLADLPSLDITPFATFDDYVDSKNLKFGSWQLRQPNKYNTLRVMATNPLSYMTQGVPFIPEELHITSETVFCTTPPKEKICLELSRLGRPHPTDNGKIYVPANQNMILDGILFRLTGLDGKIVNHPYLGVDKALSLLAGETLEIFLTDASPSISLLLQMTSADVKIRYYKRVQTGLDASQMPVFGWSLITAVTKTAAQATTPILYENAANPISKIAITAGRCRSTIPCIEYDDKIIALEAFLNRLLKTKRLGNGRLVNMSDGIYHTSFKEFLPAGKLWETVPQMGLYVQSKFNKDGSIFILITTKDKRWRCEIKLTSPEKINFVKYPILRFLNLRPDLSLSQNGDNTAFLVEAELIINGVKTVITLRGTSCIALRKCETTGHVATIELNKVGEKMLSLLTSLSQQKRLVQTRKLNITGGKYAKEFTDIRQIGLFETKNPIHYEAEQVSSNDINIQMSYDNQRKFISLETENEGVEGFTINALESFSNLRANPEKIGNEDRHFFLIDTMFQRKKITLAGETNFTIFEQTENPSTEILSMVAPKVVKFDCGNLTPEAKDLEEFISTLGKLNHLTERQPVPLIEFNEYKGSYFESSLFPKEASPEKTTWQLFKTSEDFRKIDCLLINFVKENREPCIFHLEIMTPNFKPDFRQLIRIFDIQADPQQGQTGLTYNFKAKAEFNYFDQLMVGEIRGSSCYPIANCEEKKCAVLLYKLCYLPEQDYIFNQTIPDISVVQQNNQSMVEAMSKLLQPIWRPQSVFALRIHTRDRLLAEGDFKTEYSNAFFIGFKTAGPLGHFHEYLNFANSNTVRPDYSALLSADKEEEFKLKSLKYYVDMEKSYPNADGRLTLAKPLFYNNPKFLLFFVKDYIYSMYGDWDSYKGNPKLDSNIQIAIIDPVDNPANPSTFIVDAAWEKNEVPYVSTDESVLINFQANGVVCTTTTQITKIGVNASFVAPELKPLKTYAAQFKARFKKHSVASFTEREVHRYVFATSRYPDFATQVNSYLTDTDFDPISHAVTHQEKALYDLSLTLNNIDIIRVQSVLAGTDSDALKTQFGHLFDRLMDGGFKLPSQAAALSTEFNIVRNTTTNHILGVLVKNPEPFNDPKIPVNILNAKKALELSVNGGASNLFQCIYSKDCSAVFISLKDNSLNMASGNYSFTFRYLEYDANTKDYVIAATVGAITLTIA